MLAQCSFANSAVPAAVAATDCFASPASGAEATATKVLILGAVNMVWKYDEAKLAHWLGGVLAQEGRHAELTQRRRRRCWQSAADTAACAAPPPP
eukprot:2948804-Pleurochrysis_carterae.AAC.1